MRLITCGCAIVGVAMLSGCASMRAYPDDPFDTQADLDALKPMYDSGAVKAYFAASADADRTQKRNQIIYGRMVVYDVEFGRFERKLALQTNAVNLGGDLAGAALTGLATTAHEAATKTNLAAAATGVLGAKAATAQDLFYQTAMPAIVAQMKANRLQVRSTIEQNLRRPDDQYPLQAALIDLQAYENAGSIIDAINSISRSAGNEKAQAIAAISMFRNLRYANTDSIKRIVAWLYPNGDDTQPPIANNLAAMVSWMKADTVDPRLNDTPWETFVRGDNADLEVDRQRFISATIH